MRKKDRAEQLQKAGTRHAERIAPAVRRLLLSAYDGGKRSLPWRGETDPYRIWVSEVMLQQTRVETVIPYYGKWLERFPDIETLAEAEEDEVLRAWQGLGYYSRARRLQEGARVVRERYGGYLPGTSQELRSLPGVGPYTAGAVASIAFREAVPAVDGNVRRVLSRLFDLSSPSSSTMRELAGVVVDPNRPGDFNQALMELGALVCTPRAPVCEECPVDSVCLALERGTVSQRHSTKRRKPLPEVYVAVVVAVARDDSGVPRLLLRKRPNSGLLAGMWEFPGVEVDTNELGSPTEMDATSLPEQAADLAEALGLGPPLMAAESSLDSEPLGLAVVTHIFSHLKARYRPFLFMVAWARVRGLEAPGCEWVSLDRLDELPLPVAQQKIARVALKAADSQGKSPRPA
jgi:A/G-specific adenine glycosylase